MCLTSILNESRGERCNSHTLEVCAQGFSQPRTAWRLPHSRGRHTVMFRFSSHLPGLLIWLLVRHTPGGTVSADGPQAPATHLILVHHLDEEREGKADLCQLGDGHTVLGAVELRGVIIDVNNQDVEGCGDGGIRRGTIVIQLSALQAEEGIHSHRNSCYPLRMPSGLQHERQCKSSPPQPQKEGSSLCNPFYR